MTIPDKLPIMRMEDYHTHYLGQTANGRLFWAYETFAFIKPHSEIIGEDWQKFRNEYAVLHTFDNDGNYLSTKHVLAGSVAETKGFPLDHYLKTMVNELGDITYKDIEIKLFQTTIDGITFGLIVDKETEMINLQPSSTISFQEPWDGEYYT
jgi:formate hydrogenlyase regulatory protein HycA